MQRRQGGYGGYGQQNQQPRGFGRQGGYQNQQGGGQAPGFQQGGYQNQARYDTRQAPQRAERTPEQEENRQLVQRYQNDLFNSALKLALLPGNIPLCYAAGTCLVTDHAVWTRFKDEDCYRAARSRADAEAGVPEENAAPFTWGLRPVPPQFLHPLAAPETIAWVWSFVLGNIAPFPAASEVFGAGIDRAFAIIAEGDATHSVTPESARRAAAGIRRALATRAFPDEETLDWLKYAITTDTPMTPGQLSATFVASPAGTEQVRNLKTLQQAEVLEQQLVTLQQRLSQRGAPAERYPAQAQRQPAQARPAVVSMISDSEDEAAFVA